MKGRVIIFVVLIGLAVVAAAEVEEYNGKLIEFLIENLLKT